MALTVVKRLSGIDEQIVDRTRELMEIDTDERQDGTDLHLHPTRRTVKRRDGVECGLEGRSRVRRRQHLIHPPRVGHHPVQQFSGPLTPLDDLVQVLGNWSPIGELQSSHLRVPDDPREDVV